MAIDGVGVDEPFYFSSSGSNDEAKFEHDGANFLIDNDTGKTKIGDKSNYHVIIDHFNVRLGVGIESPLFEFHAWTTGANSTLVAERDDGAIGEIQARADNVFMGARSNNELKFIVNNSVKATFNLNGDFQIPAAVTTVISSPTDLYIGSDGTLGPNPSSDRFKENIRDITNIPGIYNLHIRMADYIGGPTDQICLIAEETELIMPEIIRYALYEKEGEIITQINRADYINIEEAEGIEPNQEQIVTLKQYKRDAMGEIELDGNGNEIIEEINKNLILLPQSVNKSDLIIPHQWAIQDLNDRLNLIEIGSITHFIENADINSRDKKIIKKKLKLK